MIVMVRKEASVHIASGIITTWVTLYQQFLAQLVTVINSLAMQDHITEKNDCKNEKFGVTIANDVTKGVDSPHFQKYALH
ncbi:hypothetical protein TNCV_388361 [Trichonephila clavipes]|nr:hypothetical protein TNCV_388361 [Trichonephila clavipes]